MDNAEKKKQKIDDLSRATVAGASYESIQVFGEAAKQHVVAYSGEDNEFKKSLTKGLKQISKSKVNDNYEYQNIHQQAGFSAEVKEVARSNAENIIKGDSERIIRTDDIGRVNDPLYDTLIIDSNGNFVEGTGSQIKFLGASEKDPTGVASAKRSLDKLSSKKFDKYLDADAKIVVPSDQYDNLVQEANKKIEMLSKQLETQKETGNIEQIKSIQERIDKLEKIKNNLRKSKVSSDEAVFARLHPELSTAIDIAKISHRAGIDTAIIASTVGGAISIIRNLVSLSKEELEPEDAVKNVIRDTATNATFGYGTGFVGTALKGAMQNSRSDYVRVLSKTNVAGTVVAVATSTSKTLARYFSGEIDGVECLEILGDQGTGMISSAMFSAIGQLAIPIPVVGGLIGGMVGYTLSSATYGILMESLKESKLAKEHRMLIEKTCEEHITMIREYRAEIERIINEYLLEKIDIFRDSFSGIKNALAIGDVDWFIESTNKITESFGGEPSFSNMAEFNKKIMSGTTFKL